MGEASSFLHCQLLSILHAPPANRPLVMCRRQGFMRLVDATGAEPYIVLNLAGKSGTELPESRLYNSSQLKARMPTLMYFHSSCARSST